MNSTPGNLSPVYGIKPQIEKILSELDFVDKYHIEVRGVSNYKKDYTGHLSRDFGFRLITRVWIVDHLYTIHVLEGKDRLEEIVKKASKGFSNTVDIYST